MATSSKETGFARDHAASFNRPSTVTGPLALAASIRAEEPLFDPIGRLWQPASKNAAAQYAKTF